MKKIALFFTVLLLVSCTKPKCNCQCYNPVLKPGVDYFAPGSAEKFARYSDQLEDSIDSSLSAAAHMQEYIYRLRDGETINIDSLDEMLSEIVIPIDNATKK